MAKQDHQYTVSKDSPLISVSHPSRYRGNHSSNVDYGFMHSAKVPEQNSKNTVVMSNLTYKHTPQVIQKLQPKVDKTRSKSLNVQGDTTGIFSRFADKPSGQPNTYFILSDVETDITDTYYLCNDPIIKKSKEVPFSEHISADVHNFPVKHAPLSHNLNNLNERLVRNVDSVKKA